MSTNSVLLVFISYNFQLPGLLAVYIDLYSKYDDMLRAIIGADIKADLNGNKIRLINPKLKYMCTNR